MVFRRAAVIIAATTVLLNCKPRSDNSEGSAVKALDGKNAPDVTGGPALDVNDVSILFAKQAPGVFYPNIDINDVMPAQTFNTLMSFAQATMPFGTTDQGDVSYGQFLLPNKYVKAVDDYVVQAGGTKVKGTTGVQPPAVCQQLGSEVQAQQTPQAASIAACAPALKKIQVTLKDDPTTRAGKEVAAEIVQGRVTCNPQPGSKSRLCTDHFAKLNFTGHRAAILQQNSWRIVGMRMDLCAGPKDKSQPCEVEFRLIAQPFGDSAPVPPKPGQPAPVVDKAGPFMFDIAAHLLYKVGFLDLASGQIKDEDGNVVTTAQAMIQDLQGVKQASSVDTNGQPLGVHPGLAAEVKQGGGAFGNAVQNLINKYTRDGNKFLITNVTTMQLAGPVTFDSSVWVFFQGTVDPAPNYDWVPTTITGGEGIWSIRTASVLGKVGRFFPPTELHSKRKAIDPIFDYEANQKVPTEHQDLPSFFDNPGKYGNPAAKIGDVTASSVLNTDCVSCHMTAPRAIERTIKSANGQGTPRPSLFQPPVGTTAYVSLEAMPRVDYSLRNFGYFLPPPFAANLKGNETGTGNIFNFPGTRKETPAVMPRVANESAELVNLINSRFVNKPNPGLTCKGEDPVAALAASTKANPFTEANQAAIRRTAKNEVAVFDCLLHEAFKVRGTFQECAQRCGATPNPTAGAGGEDQSDAQGDGSASKAGLKCKSTKGVWAVIAKDGSSFTNPLDLDADIFFDDQSECERALATSKGGVICLRGVNKSDNVANYSAFRIKPPKQDSNGLRSLDECVSQMNSAKF